MKRILTVIALCSAVLFSSCATPGTVSVQPQDLRSLSTVATAAAFVATEAKDRPALAVKLTAAAGAIEVLTAETVNPEDVRLIIASQLGRANPEYVILGSLLADYLGRTIATGDPGRVKAGLNLIAQGVRTAAAAYAVPPVPSA